VRAAVPSNPTSLLGPWTVELLVPAAGLSPEPESFTGIDRGKGFGIVLDLVVAVGPVLVVVAVGPVLVVVAVGPVLVIVVGPDWLLVVAVAWSAQAAVVSVMVASVSTRTAARIATRSELRRRSSRFVAKATPVASDIARSPPHY